MMPGVAYGALDALFEAKGKFNTYAGYNTLATTHTMRRWFDH